MPDYYPQNNVLGKKPGLIERPVRPPQGGLAALVIVVLLAGCAWAAVRFGPSGHLSAARVREAVVLIEIHEGDEVAYRSGWLCSPTVVITSRDAVVGPSGNKREGLVVQINGGTEKCEIQNVEFDAGTEPDPQDAAGLRRRYGVITLQSPQRRLRPLLCNVDKAAVVHGTPVRLLGFNQQRECWPPAPIDAIRRIHTFQNSDVMVPYFQAPNDAVLIGAPLIDLRDFRVIGMLVSNSSAPGASQGTALQWALPIHLLKPVLESREARWVQ